MAVATGTRATAAAATGGKMKGERTLSFFICARGKEGEGGSNLIRHAEKFSKHEIDVPHPNGECGKDIWERSII